jgi:pyrroloquinoline-quinone synthase
MKFAEELRQNLGPRHLLRHPFYTAWTDGSLSLEQLREYARQYFHHVAAFPRYVSATHSRCDDVVARQVLLENLNDEEAGDEHHPELWLRFAEGLGCPRPDVRDASPRPETRALVDTFFRRAYASYEEGLGALFAYEHQVPEVAEFKLEALRTQYGIDDARTLAFFEVHRAADVAHAEAVGDLLEQLTPEQRARCERSAGSASRALWGFLNGVQRPGGNGGAVA